MITHEAQNDMLSDYSARNELEIAIRRWLLAVAGRAATKAKRIELLGSESAAGFHNARRAPKVSDSRSYAQKGRRRPRGGQRPPVYREQAKAIMYVDVGRLRRGSVRRRGVNATSLRAPTATSASPPGLPPAPRRPPPDPYTSQQPIAPSPQQRNIPPRNHLGNP